MRIRLYVIRQSPKFMEAYFKYLHHPREEEGVDFWWIDWQQGSNCKIEGLDPLWIFNHFHFLDSARERKTSYDFFQICRSRKPQISGRIFRRYT